MYFMSAGLGGLPSVLDAYFSAINAGDIEGAVKYVSADATVTVHDAPRGAVQAVGREGYAAWLAQSMTIATVTVVPLTAEGDDESVRVELAVSVLRPPNEPVTLRQQVEYTIENGLIVAVQVWATRLRNRLMPPVEPFDDSEHPEL